MAINTTALAVVVLFVCSMALAANTNNLPVPVTGENSGPRYDIDMESTSSNLVEPTTSQATRNENGKPLKEDINGKPEQEDNKEPTEAEPGRLAIRRLWIYSDPMQPRVRLINPWTSMGMNQQRQNHPDNSFSMDSDNVSPFISLRPTTVVNPFRSIFSDMLGNHGRDEEREDGSTTNEEKEESQPAVTHEENPELIPKRIIDPHQLMLDLLHHALSTRLNNFGGDLGLSPPSLTPGTNASDKPEMKTESKEDIVEIDGEKYLRKTVISKHIGENMMFMTKRYILTPLNATTPANDQADSTVTTQASPIDKRQQSSTPADKSVEIEGPVATSAVEVLTSTPAKPIVIEPTASPSATPTIPEVSTTTAASVLKDTIEKEGDTESVAKALPEFSSAPTTRDRVIKRKGSDIEN